MEAQPDPAFTAYVRARQRHFLRAAYLICGDEHLAHDLVQQALIKLATRWSRLQHENPDAYVRKILYHDSVSSWRRTRREVTYADPDRRVARDGYEVVEQRADLVAALRELPPGQRAVIVLRYFEDRTEQETADLLGIRVGTVKSQAHAALSRLRTRIPTLQATTAKE